MHIRQVGIAFACPVICPCMVRKFLDVLSHQKAWYQHWLMATRSCCNCKNWTVQMFCVLLHNHSSHSWQAVSHNPDILRCSNPLSQRLLAISTSLQKLAWNLHTAHRSWSWMALSSLLEGADRSTSSGVPVFEGSVACFVKEGKTSFKLIHCWQLAKKHDYIKAMPASCLVSESEMRECLHGVHDVAMLA